LLKYGADPHARNNQGKTPVQMAQAKGHDHIVKLLS
jgi:ankyrin repeat protein